MTRSRLEINIHRLLKNTETLSTDNPSDWRLEKYVETLNIFLTELKKKIQRPDTEKIKEYSRRIEFLKKLVDLQKIDNSVAKVVALQLMSHGNNSPEENISREIHQKTISKYNLDVRNDLFGVTEDEIKLRKTKNSTGEDLDSVIKCHQNVQQKIVNDMLLLTRDLKEQSKVAQNIIQKDIETLQKSSGLTDKNLSKLKLESVKLGGYNKKAWRCWMWVLIFIVIFIFMFMVLFIKIT